MKDILTIMRKETLDTLRDKRTLTVMVIMPMVILPLILFITATVTRSSAEKEMQKEITLGWVADSPASELEQLLDQPESLKMRLVQMEDSSLFRDLIPDSLDAGIYIGPDFAQQLGQRGQGTISFFYDQTEDLVKERVKGTLAMYQSLQESKRLQELGLNQQSITPIEIDEIGVASRKEVLGKLAGGFLPYIIIIFSFLGCMYTSIDMFAGEKERGSFETILTVPVERWKILVGKMGVIVLMGMVTTSLGFLGIYVGMSFSDALPPQIVDVINGILSPGFILALLGMMFLLTIFFAGFMTPVSLYAKNFKEAQSIITPLQIVAIVPALIGAFPGVELNTGTALIPVLNIVLSTKEIIAGTLEPMHMVLVILSLLVLAGLSVFVSFKRFDREQNVLRI